MLAVIGHISARRRRSINVYHHRSIIKFFDTVILLVENRSMYYPSITTVINAYDKSNLFRLGVTLYQILYGWKNASISADTCKRYLHESEKPFIDLHTCRRWCSYTSDARKRLTSKMHFIIAIDKAKDVPLGDNTIESIFLQFCNEEGITNYKIIHATENYKVMAMRNVVLNYAQTDLIWFNDDDDMILQSLFDKYNAIVAHGVNPNVKQRYVFNHRLVYISKLNVLVKAPEKFATSKFACNVMTRALYKSDLEQVMFTRGEDQFYFNTILNSKKYITHFHTSTPVEVSIPSRRNETTLAKFKQIAMINAFLNKRYWYIPKYNESKTPHQMGFFHDNYVARFMLKPNDTIMKYHIRGGSANDIANIDEYNEAVQNSPYGGNANGYENDTIKLILLIALVALGGTAIVALVRDSH